MRIQSESRVHHPRDKVFRAYRDRLPEIAAYLSDIREIIVRSREQLGDEIRLHNEWVADREIPKVLQVVVKPEMLRWDDFATWREGALECHWTLKTRAFTESVHCSGTNLFLEDGPGATRVVLTGELRVDLDRLPGVPGILSRKLGPQVEKFVVSLITPNLERVNQSLERFLDDQA